MARLTKAQVIEILDEFAAVEKRIRRLEAKRNDDLEPLVQAHDEACKPVLADYEKKAAKLVSARKMLVDQIDSYLDAAGRDQVIASEKAYASRKTETRIGRRVIDPEAFFKTVTQKGKEFWACLRVEILKAERFLGKTTVDEISSKEEETVVVKKLDLL